VDVLTPLGDYWGYDYFSLDASYNGEKSPIKQDPTVDLGFGPPALRLAINTDQYGTSRSFLLSTSTLRCVFACTAFRA
jgi:hypothetical protein